MFLDCAAWYPEDRTEQMEVVAGVTALVDRLGDAAEGVGEHDTAPRIAMGPEDCLHGHARTAPPDAGLDEVARYVVCEDLLDRLVQLVEPASTDHREAMGRPVVAFGPQRIMDRALDTDAIAVDAAGTGPSQVQDGELDKFDIALA